MADYYKKNGINLGIIPSTIKGEVYRLANNWFDIVRVDKNKEIRYLEIGSFVGANLVSVANTYCSHPNSRLFCIDPWIDYEDYPEYKGRQMSIYNTFIENIEAHKEKIVIKRGYSHEEVPKFEDNYFDLIYIDGNHEPDYVLEDAVLCFRKLKPGGVLIFDDYGWGGPDLTKRGIDGFLNGYHKKIKVLGMRDTQVFVLKK